MKRIIEVGLVPVLVLLASIAVMFPRARLVAAGFGIGLLALAFVHELIWNRRRPHGRSQYTLTTSGTLKLASRCLLITDRWDGARQKQVAPMPEVVRYQLVFQIDNEQTIDSLTISGVGGAGSEPREESFKVSVDTGSLIFACRAAFGILTDNQIVKQVTLDLMKGIENGDCCRHATLRLKNDIVGLVFIPSLGDGIYDVTVERVDSGSIHVTGHFGENERE